MSQEREYEDSVALSENTGKKKAERGEIAANSARFPAGLLFFHAGQTAPLEKRILHLLGQLGGSLMKAVAVQKEGELLRQLNGMLEKARCVFVVSGAPGVAPEAAEPVFRALGAKLTPEGEPKGIFTLSGKHKRGYLPESREKVICLLPDDDGEAEGMLREAGRRLSEKFSLSYAEEKPAFLDQKREEETLRSFFAQRDGFPRIPV